MTEMSTLYKQHTKNNPHNLLHVASFRKKVAAVAAGLLCYIPNEWHPMAANDGVERQCRPWLCRPPERVAPSSPTSRMHCWSSTSDADCKNIRRAAARAVRPAELSVARLLRGSARLGLLLPAAGVLGLALPPVVHRLLPPELLLRLRGRVVLARATR
jgi:hypothetical protein